MRGLFKAVVLAAPVLAAAFVVPPRPGHVDVEEVVDELSPVDEPCAQEFPKITPSGGILIPIDVQASSPDSDESQRLLVDFGYKHAATVCGEPHILINEEKIELENDGHENFIGHGLFKMQGREVAASWGIRCDRNTKGHGVFQIMTFKVDSVDEVQVLEDDVGFIMSTEQVQEQHKHNLDAPEQKPEHSDHRPQHEHENHPYSSPHDGLNDEPNSLNSLYTDVPNWLGLKFHHDPLLFILLALLFVCAPVLIFVYHKCCCCNSRKRAASREARREKRRSRRAARKACKEAWKSWAASWKIRFHSYADFATDDSEEKRQRILESDVASEISELRNAADIVCDLVAMEEGRSSERVSFETVLPEYMSEAGSEKLPSYGSTFGDEEGTLHSEDSVVADGFRPRHWTTTSSSVEGSLRSIIDDNKS